MSTPTRIGRPKVIHEELVPLYIRMTKGERQAIKLAASQKGMTIKELVLSLGKNVNL
ncbi:hypothetical protein [Chroococcus sp. FPU101]|uniref:hypothetical protein n=1 Tax=Chroococcus sp. FPU101 TaxID=1974212 RepID=UPI001A8F9C9E|nr:hypothetical protein [Chroococcus sp. FPU101]GFE70051.1 hypothetical protein CFPU101_26610 [Chroococcus sp. FPU101]